MRNHAQIVDNKILGIFIFENEATFEPEEGYFVDVTDIKPPPSIGWFYEPKTRKFSITPKPKKVQNALRRRMEGISGSCLSRARKTK